MEKRNSKELELHGKIVEISNMSELTKAKIGILALIDESTGYQEKRFDKKNDLLNKARELENKSNKK